MLKGGVALALLIVALAGAVEVAAQSTRTKDPARIPTYRGLVRELPRGTVRSWPAHRAFRFAVVAESEPNNDAGTATAVTLGDQATGVIDPAADIDYFSISLTAGTVVDIDVDASEVGSPLDPVLGFFDTDGITILIENDDFDGLDSRIKITIPADGVYFVAIVDFGAGGAADFTYTINFNTKPLGPGDPRHYDRATEHRDPGQHRRDDPIAHHWGGGSRKRLSGPAGAGLRRSGSARRDGQREHG